MQAAVPQIVVIKHPELPTPPTTAPTAPVPPLVFISPIFRSTSTQATDGSTREAPRNAPINNRRDSLCNRYADLRRKVAITLVNTAATQVANFVSGTAGFIFNQRCLSWIVDDLDYQKFMFTLVIGNIIPSTMLGIYLTPQLQAKQKSFEMFLITLHMFPVAYISAYMAAKMFNLDNYPERLGFMLVAAANGALIFMALMAIIENANEYTKQRCCANNRARDAETNEDANPRSSSETDARSTPRPR